jgi:integrase
VWELQAEAALLLGQPLPPVPADKAEGVWTLGEMLDWAYREHWAAKGDPAYFAKNIRVLKKDLGEKFPAADLIGKVGFDRLKAACEARGNSGDTINKKASLVSKALKLSIERGKLQGVSMVPFPRLKGGPGRTFILSREQESACLAWLRQFDPEMAQWFQLGIDTGFRSYSEGLHIYPWADVRTSPDGGLLLTIRGRLVEEAEDLLPSEVIDIATARRRVKTGEGVSRTVGIPRRSVSLVEEWRKRLSNRRNAPMFEDLGKQRITKNWNLMKDALGITDPGCVPYSLRHTFGTRAILSGIDIDTLRVLMGHSTRKMTEKYMHLAGLVETGAVAKLDKYLGGDQ